MRYDMAIRGAVVIDPAEELHDRRDIGIADGRIAAVEPRISPEEAEELVDASGKLVTPGWIDLHVHVYEGVSHFGVPVDATCLARGVTTALDAGSAGAQTFGGFKKYILDVSATRVKALLNISLQGMLSREVGELEDIRWASVPRAIQTCEQYRDDILGVKVRLSPDLVGPNGLESLKRAREAAEAVGLPLMVHPNAAPFDMETLLAELRSGDVITHCFHRSETGVLDPAGAVRPSVRQAVERGVHLDVGHGAGSFNFEVAEAAMRQGLSPHTISSDLHAYNVNGPVHDLATTASKFLCLGLEMDDVIRMVTATPAETFNFGEALGSLKIGAPADLAIFDLVEGPVELRDAHGQTRVSQLKLEPVSVVHAGRLRARSVLERGVV